MTKRRKMEESKQGSKEGRNEERKEEKRKEEGKTREQVKLMKERNERIEEDGRK